jgi:hypothetical protein
MVIADRGGNPMQLVGISVDVTAHQNALKSDQEGDNLILGSGQLIQSRIRRYFDTASDCLFLIRVTADRKFVYEALNLAKCAFTGFNLEAMGERSPEDVLGEEKGGIITRAVLRVLQSRSTYLDERSGGVHASTVGSRLIYVPLFDDMGEVAAILGKHSVGAGSPSTQTAC